MIATEIGKAKRELVELYKLGQAEMETEIKYASFIRVPTCDHCALKSSTICARHGGTIHSTLSCVADAPCRCFDVRFESARSAAHSLSSMGLGVVLPRRL